MSDARVILHARSREIRAMQRYIAALERGDAPILASAKHGTVGFRRTDETLVFNSIKASFIIMLYNLAEAIVVSTIDEIFRRVDGEGLGYDRVVSEIRDFWLKLRAARIRQGGSEKFMDLVKEAIDSALSKEGLSAFEREEIRKGYMGNVDAKLIRQIASDFAIPLTPRRSTRGGEKLRWIKDHRNDLGHGTYSFSEVGADQTADDLRDTSVRVRRFLFDAVLSFERYLDTRAYAVPRVA